MFSGICVPTDNMKDPPVQNFIETRNQNSYEENMNIKEFYPKRSRLVFRTLHQIINGKVQLKRLGKEEIDKWSKRSNLKNSKTGNGMPCVDIHEKETNAKNYCDDNTFSLQPEKNKYTELQNKDKNNITITDMFPFYGPLVNGKTMIYPKKGATPSETENTLDFENPTFYYQCLMCRENKHCLVELIEHNVKKHLSESVLKCGYCFKFLDKNTIKIYSHQKMEHPNKPVEVEEYSLRKDACKNIYCNHNCLFCKHTTLNVNHALYHASQHMNQTLPSCSLCTSPKLKPNITQFANKSKLHEYFVLNFQNDKISGDKPEGFTFEKVFEKKTQSSFCLKKTVDLFGLDKPIEGLKTKTLNEKHYQQPNKSFSSSNCHKRNIPTNETNTNEVIDLSIKKSDDKNDSNSNEEVNKGSSSTNFEKNGNQLNFLCDLNQAREKPVYYSCKICGVNSSKKKRLEDHIKSHMNDYAYHCSKCSFTSLSLKNIKHHRNQYHSDSDYNNSYTLKDKKELKRLCMKKCKFPYQFPTNKIKVHEEVPLNFPIDHIDKSKLSSLTWTRMAFGKDRLSNVAQSSEDDSNHNGNDMTQSVSSSGMKSSFSNMTPMLNSTSAPNPNPTPPPPLPPTRPPPLLYPPFQPYSIGMEGTTIKKPQLNPMQIPPHPINANYHPRRVQSIQPNFDRYPHPFGRDPNVTRQMSTQVESQIVNPSHPVNFSYSMRNYNVRNFKSFEVNGSNNNWKQHHGMTNLQKLENVVNGKMTISHQKLTSCPYVIFHCRYCPHITNDPSHLYDHIHKHKLNLNESDKYHLIRLSSQKSKDFPNILKNSTSNEFEISLVALQKHWVAK